MAFHCLDRPLPTPRAAHGCSHSMIFAPSASPAAARCPRCLGPVVARARVPAALVPQLSFDHYRASPGRAVAHISVALQSACMPHAVEVSSVISPRHRKPLPAGCHPSPSSVASILSARLDTHAWSSCRLNRARGSHGPAPTHARCGGAVAGPACLRTRLRESTHAVVPQDQDAAGADGLHDRRLGVLGEERRQLHPTAVTGVSWLGSAETERRAGV